MVIMTNTIGLYQTGDISILLVAKHESIAYRKHILQIHFSWIFEKFLF